MTTAPRTPPTLARRAVAEALGTAMLLATVVGSGIMAERLTAAYWLTASTSFANPAVTLARAATDSFAGIRPDDVPGFVAAQLSGAGVATALFRWLVPALPEVAPRVVVAHGEAASSALEEAP